MAIELVGDVDLNNRHVRKLMDLAAKYFDTFDLLEKEPTIYIIVNEPSPLAVHGERYHTSRIGGGHTVFITGMIAAVEKKIKNRRAKKNREARNELLESVGMRKVRGNLGGTFWE